MWPLKSWILTSLQTKKLKCRKVRWFILDHRDSKCQNQCLRASSPIPEFILLFFLEDVTQEFAHILHVFHHSTFFPCSPSALSPRMLPKLLLASTPRNCQYFPLAQKTGHLRSRPRKIFQVLSHTPCCPIFLNLVFLWQEMKAEVILLQWSFLAKLELNCKESHFAGYM